MGTLVWHGGTLIRIMDESGDAHRPQEIKVFTARLVHYLLKLTAHQVCLGTSIDHMSEWVGGPGSCAGDCSSLWLSIFQRVTKCPGDLEPEQETFVYP